MNSILERNDSKPEKHAKNLSAKICHHLRYVPITDPIKREQKNPKCRTFTNEWLFGLLSKFKKIKPASAYIGDKKRNNTKQTTASNTTNNSRKRKRVVPEKEWNAATTPKERGELLKKYRKLAKSKKAKNA